MVQKYSVCLTTLCWDYGVVVLSVDGPCQSPDCDLACSQMQTFWEHGVV
jgi:hypothetical protein